MDDNYVIIMSRLSDDSSHWVLEPRLGNNQNSTYVQMPAEHRHEEGQLSLFDWSETGLSDTVTKITARQHMRSRIKACTVDISQTQNPSKATIKI